MTSTKRRCLAAVTLILIGWLLSTGATQLPPVALGAETGSRIEIPFAVDLVSGDPIETRKATVYIFSVLHPCTTCNLAYTVANDWARTYPNLQVAIVTKAGSAEMVDEVRREALSRNLEARVVVDEGAFVEAFNLNTQPVFFLVDAESTVQARLTGSNPGRLLAFDGLLERANRNDWSGVLAHRHEPLIEGESGVPPLLQQYATTSPLIVYVHSPTCILCRHLVEDGIQDLVNDYARLHPDVSFVVFQEASQLAIVDVLGDLVSRFSVDVLYEPERTMFLDGEASQESVSLRSDDWADNVAFVTFVSGSDSDPGWLWGRVTTPDLFSFDGRGIYVGPSPYWRGPYDLAGVARFLNGAVRE